MKIKRYQWIFACNLLLVLFVCSSAWAGVADEPGRRGYKFSENTPHLWLYWNCDRSAQDAMGIEGLVEVKGQSNTPAYGLQLTLVGFNAKGKPIGEEMVLAPHKMLESTSYRFRISLPLKGGETDFGLRVYYRFVPVYGGTSPVASRMLSDFYNMDFWDWTFRGICSPE